MKVNAKVKTQGCLFEDIGCGEVFYGTDDPNMFYLRTDGDVHVAVNLESGVMYQYDEFEDDNVRYFVVNAEVTIS